MLSKILAVTAFILLAQSAFSLTINDINKAIDAKGANWKAGKTSVWSIPIEGKMEMMGAPSVQEKEFAFHVPKNGSKDIPSKLDWRNKNGMNYMSPVTNQGRCGSCVAFAAVGVLEGQINASNGWPGLNMDFSEQQLFGCGGGSCNRGWYPGSAASYLKKNGVVDEACLPYTSGSTGENVSCSAACSNASSRKTRILSYQMVGGWFSSDSDVMKALQDGPLLGTMTVYEDFIAYTGGVYEHVTGGRLGGHAITLVGYDNVENYWIVRNSWGANWGEGGYFRIRMGDSSGVGNSCYKMNIDPYGGTARINAPSFREVISGSYNVMLESSVSNTETMKLELVKGGSVTTYNAVRAKEIDRFVVNLNTSELEDGVYEARSVAVYKVGNSRKEKKSQFKQFFVLNSTPTIEVGISHPENNAELKERVIASISVSGSPIPVMKLVFNIKDQNGNIKKVVNENPTSTTLMSWKTQHSANGRYEIWVEGFTGEHKVESTHFNVTVNN